MSAHTEVTIGGRRLKLSNLDKVIYPMANFTKAQVIDYYVRIAPAMLPHLEDRPISLKRYPNGVDGFFFFEKRCPAHRPEWVATSTIPVKSGDINFCLCDGPASLAWLGNLACLEIHTYLYRHQSPYVPTMLVFDLDPGPEAGLLDCCEIAILLRDLLERHGLQSFIKTSGSKGLHLCVPLNTPSVTFEQTKAWSRAAAQVLAARMPDRVTSIMAKSERTGKVFIDWSQNDFSKTTCCVYSLRARELPTVSTPLTWSAVEGATARSVVDMMIEAPRVLMDVAAHGDRYAEVLTLSQRLPELLPQASDLTLNRTSSRQTSLGPAEVRRVQPKRSRTRSATPQVRRRSRS